MFQGFTPQTQEFLWNIRFNNERTWFLEHKEEYLTQVATPMQQLAQEVHDRFASQNPKLGLQLRVSRIYRDARRLHGRGPYKDHLWFTLQPPGEQGDTSRPVFYFEIAPEYYGFGMGCYRATPLTGEKLRARIDRDPQPLEKLARRLNQNKHFSLEGPVYVRPKGDPGPLLSPWYNRRSLSIGRDESWEGAVFTPQLVEEILDGFTFLLPFYQYFDSLAADPNPRIPSATQE